MCSDSVYIYGYGSMISLIVKVKTLVRISHEFETIASLSLKLAEKAALPCRPRRAHLIGFLDSNRFLHSSYNVSPNLPTHDV